MRRRQKHTNGTKIVRFEAAAYRSRSMPVLYGECWTQILKIDKDLVRTGRFMLKWSPGELSDHSGVPFASISAFEQGNSELSMEDFVRIVDCFATAGCIAYFNETGAVEGFHFCKNQPS